MSLDVGGSFVLTGDLYSALPDEDLVLISVSGVTLDLNGFSLLGPNRCSYTSGTDMSCTLVGSGAGVRIDVPGPPEQGHVSVRNGKIFGRPGPGVTNLGFYLNGIFEDLMISHSGDLGLLVNGIVRRCRVEMSRSDGIQARGVLQECIAMENGGSGIVVRDGQAGRHRTLFEEAGSTPAASTSRPHPEKGTVPILHLELEPSPFLM